MHEVLLTTEELQSVLDALRYSAAAQLSQYNRDLADRIEWMSENRD